MKTYLTVALLLCSLTVLCQSSTQNNYCLPIEKARLLVEDATKKKVLDTIVHTQALQINLLTKHNFQTYNDFQGLLSIERSKFNEQKAINEDLKKHSQSFSDQLKYIQKKERKQRMQNRVLKAGITVAAGFIVYQGVR